MTIAEKVASTQARANVVQQVVDHLRDSTKILTSETLQDLADYARMQSSNFSLDKTVVHRVVQQRFQNEKLHNEFLLVWNRQEELKKQLSELRKYLGVETPEELSAAVAAGKTQELPKAQPTTPAHFVPAPSKRTAEELAAIKARAIERAQAAQTARKK